MSNYKVSYDVKHTDRSCATYSLLVDRKSYFDTFLEAQKFSKEIYGLRKNGIEVIGRPMIERM